MKIRQLGVPAIPLRFLEYLIENPVPAVALGRKLVLVKIPQPARCAVHKLIVSRERKPSQRLKAQKDLQQSHELQQILRQLDPEALDEAFDAARSIGPGWKKWVDDGQKAIDRRFRPLRLEHALNVPEQPGRHTLPGTLRSCGAPGVS